MHQGHILPTVLIALYNTGTVITNIAGYFGASGATNNYGIIVPSSVDIRVFTPPLPNSYLDVAGSFGTGISAISSATTLDASYSTVLATPSSAYTITLPAANTTGRRLYSLCTMVPAVMLLRFHGQALIISPRGSSITTLALTGGSVTLQSDGVQMVCR